MSIKRHQISHHLLQEHFRYFSIQKFQPAYLKVRLSNTKRLKLSHLALQAFSLVGSYYLEKQQPCQIGPKEHFFSPSLSHYNKQTALRFLCVLYYLKALYLFDSV